MSKKAPAKGAPKGKVKLSPEEEAKAAADKVSEVENPVYKRSLREEARSLKSMIDDEEKFLSLYQQEREKLNYNWLIAKKELEDRKSELLNKEREIQDLKENHIMTINLYKQKVKHLLFQNQDKLTELKKDVEVTLKQLEDENRMKDRELKTDNRALKVQTKEKEADHVDYMSALDMENVKVQNMLRQEYERVFSEVKAKYHLKMQKLRQEMEEQRIAEIKKIEEKKENAIKALTDHHKEKYSNIKSYYSDITATNLDLIKGFKTKIHELQGAEDTDRQTLQKIENEKRSLEEPMKQYQEDIKQLKLLCAEKKKIEAEKEILKAKIQDREKRFRDLEYKYEVKLQNFKYLDREKNGLFDKFVDSVYKIQQKTGLQNLILEKKISSINEVIEGKDLELNQGLNAAHIDPRTKGVITKTIEEVEAAKSDLINELQNELSQIRKAHSHMVKAYEGKLAEFVIPVEELGFDPLVPTNTE